MAIAVSLGVTVIIVTGFSALVVEGRQKNDAKEV